MRGYRPLPASGLPSFSRLTTYSPPTQPLSHAPGHASPTPTGTPHWHRSHRTAATAPQPHHPPTHTTRSHAHARTREKIEGVLSPSDVPGRTARYPALATSPPLPSLDPAPPSTVRRAISHSQIFVISIIAIIAVSARANPNKQQYKQGRAIDFR